MYSYIAYLLPNYVFKFIFRIYVDLVDFTWKANSIIAFDGRHACRPVADLSTTFKKYVDRYVDRRNAKFLFFDSLSARLYLPDI